MADSHTKGPAKLFDVSTKNIIVVGGCGLVGRELSKIFAEIGANVIVTDVVGAGPEELAKSLPRRPGQVVKGLSVDISRKPEVEGLVSKATSEMDFIDVLINAAQYKPGGFFDFDAETLPVDVWEQILSVNLTGVFLTSQIVGRKMLEQGKGSIINIASTYGVVSSNPWLYEDNAMRNPVAYSASKSGVIMLTKYLAVHWAKKGVRVNCLTPHGVFNSHESAFVERFSRLSPMGRMMDVKELVGPVLFLASDASSYMTGSNLIVDGGWTSW